VGPQRERTRVAFYFFRPKISHLGLSHFFVLSLATIPALEQVSVVNYLLVVENTEKREEPSENNSVAWRYT